MEKITIKTLKALRNTKFKVCRCSGRFNGVMVLILFLSFNGFSQSDTLSQNGYLQYQQNHFDSAVVSFTQLITEHPEKKEGYYNRGLSYYQLKKLPQALNDFNACLQIDSVFDDARFMKTSTLQAMGEWQNAFIEFSKLNTNYAGYKELKKAIRYHNLSVYISRNWYYMIAIMFMFIILAGIVAKSYYTYKG